MERLLGLGPSAVVLTRGRHGASGWYGAARRVESGVEVAVADTIGAGDTFGAAAIDALWERAGRGAEGRRR